jgi:hypothetical protein
VSRACFSRKGPRSGLSRDESARSDEDGVFFEGEGFLEEEEGVGEAGAFLGTGVRRTGVSLPP